MSRRTAAYRWYDAMRARHAERFAHLFEDGNLPPRMNKREIWEFYRWYTRKVTNGHHRNHGKGIHLCGKPYHPGCPLHGGYNRRNRKGRPPRAPLRRQEGLAWLRGDFGWI